MWQNSDFNPSFRLNRHLKENFSLPPDLSLPCDRGASWFKKKILEKG